MKLEQEDTMVYGDTMSTGANWSWIHADYVAQDIYCMSNSQLQHFLANVW